ncbi:MAG TPA: MBL fold metallo-hydrolase [Pirellulales bacterium]|jgi:glyoxylase-like metal-dependent hydrolase (beta-lactamase superfamily II)|nr:MBL fold metallo-hydrolase [Pirellulales bacterium]
MLKLGPWQLETVTGGRFWLDAGVMYGIIPKAVWQGVTPANSQNRIPVGIHCILARNGEQTVLIDTGHGDKLSPLDRSAHALEKTPVLLDSLAALGVEAEDVDMVVFSHLHWDHAGGATRLAEDRRCRATFPRATYFVNRLEWEDANSGVPELAGSYAAENFVPLSESGQLVLVDGEVELAPGLWTRPTGGHTRGHQALVFESGDEAALYLGDLCPVVGNLRRMWITAYDLYPMETRQRKPQMLGEVADRGWWMLWDHDPNVAVSRIARHASREFVVVDGRAQL